MCELGNWRGQVNRRGVVLAQPSGVDCRVENVLWRVQNGEMDFVNPVKVVVLLVGTNNVNNEPENIFEGLMEIIKEIKTRLGNVTIILPVTYWKLPIVGQ